jgi:putative FmdB family regulatory protein
MALYEFKCKKCLVITQDSLPITSNIDKVKCWKCGNFSAERIISKSSFIMKGYSEKNGYSKKGD